MYMYFCHLFFTKRAGYIRVIYYVFGVLTTEAHVVVITPPLRRDEGTARTAIQVHAVNLIEVRLGERWQLISNQSWVTGSPTTNKVDCHWWVPKSRLLQHAELATSQL